MDFASLMSRELIKDAVPSSKKSDDRNGAKETSGEEAATAKKYTKKADLEQQREQAYREEQAALKREREGKASRKRQSEEDEAARKRERDEKRRRLAEESRKRREEEEAKKERARRKRLGLPEIPVSTTTTTTTTTEEADAGGKNDKDEQESESPATTTTTANLDLPVPTTLALLPESDLKVLATPPSDPSTHPYLYRQLTSYFTLLLRAWRDALAARPSSVSSTSAGKQALAAYTTSLTNLRPLFAHFERGTFPSDLLAAVLEIVSAAQERRYVDANDAYLRLSIGKAAWPIGVTMVGIHERSAREKLSEHGRQDVAHIMSDEGTRKWLQSLKRCLSFAQTRWPPEDIGQMMG